MSNGNSSSSDNSIQETSGLNEQFREFDPHWFDSNSFLPMRHCSYWKAQSAKSFIQSEVSSAKPRRGDPG